MLTFDEGTHTYRLDGVVVPSVTQVLQRFVVDATWYTEVSRLRGTMVHRALELYDTGRMPSNPGIGELQPYLDAWIRFKAEADFQTEESEVRLASTRFRFAGTLDKVGLFRPTGEKGRCEAILDIKTGEPERWWGLQLAAYQQLDYERTGRWRRRFDLVLREDSTFNLIEQRGTEDRGVFLACLTVYHWLEGPGL